MEFGEISAKRHVRFVLRTKRIRRCIFVILFCFWSMPNHVDLSNFFFQQLKFMNMELMTDAPGFCGPSTVSKNRHENWFVQTPLIWGISMIFKDQIGVHFKKRNDLSNRFSTVFLHNSLSAFATQTFHGLVRVIPTLLQTPVACGASTGLVHGWWSHRISSFVFIHKNCTFWIICFESLFDRQCLPNLVLCHGVIMYVFAYPNKSTNPNPHILFK